MFTLSSLNSQQQKAVTRGNGPVLVLAGPGSGKTKTLTYRVAYLLSQGVRAYEMLVLTFTKKAAREMKERALALLEDTELAHEGLAIGTFHSAFATFLRQEAKNIERGSNFVIYDKSDQLAVLKTILDNLGVESETISPAYASFVISKAKSKLQDENGYASNAYTQHERDIAEVYRVYQKRLKEANAFDFDDLIMAFACLLEEKSEVLSRYQKRFRHILVDEYQDTNPAQYRALRLLAEQSRNLFAVADDWQAIYSFRNADVSCVMNFKIDWPEGTIIPLEQNYRSTKTILLAAQQLIEQNKRRMEKNLWTDNDQGARIVIKETLDEIQEAAYVVRMVNEYASKTKDDLAHVAVLFRTNTQARAIEEMLLRHGIPYQTRGLVRFYERKEVKDIVSYLRILHNPTDYVALSRIINTPPRGIGPLSVKKILRFSTLLGDRAIPGDLDLTPAPKKALQRFLDLYERFHKARLSHSLEELIGLVVKESGYEKLLRNAMLTEEKETIVQELQSFASRFEGSAIESLPSFLDELSLFYDEEGEGGAKGVNLMTVHAAKGLEFPIVFITGLEHGVFPHYKSIAPPQELEEERRLFYVAMTRAQTRLFLTYARIRRLYGRTQSNPPSNFLDELPPELVVRE